MVENALTNSAHEQVSDATRNYQLLHKLAVIYDLNKLADVLNTVTGSGWTRDRVKTCLSAAPDSVVVSPDESTLLSSLLPKRPAWYSQPKFRFIDLFAGIGGIRSGFEAIGGKCVLTSEWNAFSARTYRANWYCDEQEHVFNADIRELTLSDQDDNSEDQAYAHIDSHIPDHDVLLAGFPCQPFSIAGVSKKNSLGRKHGFEDSTQGTLFFDVCRVLRAKQPGVFVLENVKNLKSHDKGNTFRVIMQTLDELGYDVADAGVTGVADPKIIDGQHFLPQHRERIVLVGFRRDLGLIEGFSLKNIHSEFPTERPAFHTLLDESVDDKYILSEKLWEYLYRYAEKHKAKGNGFGYGLVYPSDKKAISRTISARYHKDGAEALVDRGWDSIIGSKNFRDPDNMRRRPRRLTPRECARLMGFEQPGKVTFRIPVSETQAYRQFGNSVIVPVFAAVARMLETRIVQAAEIREAALKRVA